MFLERDVTSDVQLLLHRVIYTIRLGSFLVSYEHAECGAIGEFGDAGVRLLHVRDTPKRVQVFDGGFSLVPRLVWRDSVETACRCTVERVHGGLDGLSLEDGRHGHALKHAPHHLHHRLVPPLHDTVLLR